MKTYSELLAVCTEFRENFAALSEKYAGVTHELQSERERSERLVKQLEAAKNNEDRLNSGMRELKKELEEALAYKDRYLAATVSVEHLKGRLENARHAVADNLLEQEQQMDQLRAQIKDLQQRLNVSADVTVVQQLKRQVSELEERCAVQNGQLLEERERFSQQLLTAHNALREQQGRQLEVEQRCRSMEAELLQMRSLVRRSSDLQNDAAVSREKCVSDARKAALQVETLTAELRDAQIRLCEAESRHAEELEALRIEDAEEKARLLERVSQLSAAADEAAAQRVQEQEKYSALQRSVHQQLETVRADAREEVAAVQKLLADSRSEQQQQGWRVEQTRAELEESKRLLRQREAKLESYAAECKQLRTQMEALTQREEWLTAERDHLSQHLAAARKQVQDLVASHKGQEESGLEVERLRIQLRFREEELQEARRLVEVSETHVKDLEDAADRRVRLVRQELKRIKKQAKVESSQAETVRRRLVHALLERDMEMRPCYSLETMERKPPQREQRVPSTYAHAFPTAPSGLDVMTLLRGQTEQAEALHQRLVELSK
ncbi:hypothetical protein, conserved [Trypanosoma brucei gambiense DAL972]|uniref:Uncharacterized protein n=2 Tax=Trypanosoma brucei TaxID=5691 RepID=D0A8F1_TRYB9|nr:hypothetical protein, conserved [Trypanosoma brucei gambiense DAL972]RHW68006.1 hypothetical protein DPX39_110066000 [Trypanosoma brucei equiperdum]CBH17952.1 hypothetical protein, conserved [Trypanosoma brucei gambiense DAL972]|eukprot:XP_011780216.1 hypothetical protein, conserved [Trypanosoma brucei gambiense DAL972]